MPVDLRAALAAALEWHHGHCDECPADGPSDAHRLWYDALHADRRPPLDRDLVLEQAAAEVETIICVDCVNGARNGECVLADAAKSIRALKTAVPEMQAPAPVRTWQEERAAVVAWMRDRANHCAGVAVSAEAAGMDQSYRDAFEEEADDMRDVADLVERGAHLPSPERTAGEEMAGVLRCEQEDEAGRCPRVASVRSHGVLVCSECYDIHRGDGKLPCPRCPDLSGEHLPSPEGSPPVTGTAKEGT